MEDENVMEGVFWRQSRKVSVSRGKWRMKMSWMGYLGDKVGRLV